MASDGMMDVCLMYFESPAGRKIVTYGHCCCKAYLLTHLEDQVTNQEEVCACPACRTKWPQQHVDTDLDNSTEGSEDGGTGSGWTSTDGTNSDDSSGIVSMDSSENGSVVSGDILAVVRGRKASLEGANCKICAFKGTQVKAVKVCEECCALPMCMECTNDHKENSLTVNHVVGSLKAYLQRKESLCGAHGEIVTMKCTTCSHEVCRLCVCLEHANHDIRSLEDIVHDNVDEVWTALEAEEERNAQLKMDQTALEESKTTAEEMEDGVIKAIEDHAEMCIQAILDKKDGLKKRLKKDFHFQVIGGLRDLLDAMPGSLKESEAVIAKAKQLLQDAELQFSYVGKLTTMKETLEQLNQGYPKYKEERDNSLDDFKTLQEEMPTFFPHFPSSSLGDFYTPEPTCEEGGPCICETCGMDFEFPDPKKKETCQRRGACFCGVCDDVIPKPSSSRANECQAKGWCTCGVCGGAAIRKPSPSRALECQITGGCSCGVCGEKFRKPDKGRVGECRKKTTCTCGTCGCVYFF